MLDTHRIRTRTDEIRKRLLVCEKDFKTMPKAKFLKDDQSNAAAERNLQVAIQASIDIANHIVSALGLERPSQEPADVFNTLAEEKIIPHKFVETIRKIVGYRNVVVHDYLKVDRNITYDIIQSHLPDLSHFVQYIEKFLEKQQSTKSTGV